MNGVCSSDPFIRYHYWDPLNLVIKKRVKRSKYIYLYKNLKSMSFHLMTINQKSIGKIPKYKNTIDTIKPQKSLQIQWWWQKRYEWYNAYIWNNDAVKVLTVWRIETLILFEKNLYRYTKILVNSKSTDYRYDNRHSGKDTRNMDQKKKKKCSDRYGLRVHLLNKPYAKYVLVRQNDWLYLSHS